MTKAVKRIAVTGAAGQIAYNLLFRLASGEVFGHDQPIALHLLELPEAFKALEGVKMELEDCAFPLLQEIHIGTDPFKVFMGVHHALLVGSKPRGPGMERAELLQDNGKIFIHQGKALNDCADRNVQVLVVGNPCNTNCLITLLHAPRIPRKNFHAMTRLDQNRACALLAARANVNVGDVSHMAIWGNHSSTQVPDFYHANIKGQPVPKIIEDQNWLQGEFISKVQKRGAEIIAARGKSSAASAANAAVDAQKSLLYRSGQWFSSGVISDDNPYGIEPGLIFSFPCRLLSNGDWEIVKDLPINEFLAAKIKATEKELLEEREIVMKFIKY